MQDLIDHTEPADLISEYFCSSVPVQLYYADYVHMLHIVAKNILFL